MYYQGPQAYSLLPLVSRTPGLFDSQAELSIACPQGSANAKAIAYKASEGGFDHPIYSRREIRGQHSGDFSRIKISSFFV